MSYLVRHALPANRRHAASAARDWTVEICLAEGRVLRARTAASDPREAVESALSFRAIQPAQLAGVSVVPA